MPEHDSLSAMVLEMLSRGRYVIYNQDLTGCHHATDFEEARAALYALRGQHEPNHGGARFVRENFSLTAEGAALAEYYTAIRG